MTEVENLPITYRIGRRFDMKLAAAALARDWMDQASRGFANCCHLDAVMWLHRALVACEPAAAFRRGAYHGGTFAGRSVGYHHGWRGPHWRYGWRGGWRGNRWAWNCGWG